MSCQPHRVTSGQSNSGHKQIHISKLFSHINPLSSQITNTKHTYTNIRHKFLKSCWYHQPFCLIHRYQIKEKYKKRNGQTQHEIKNCYINAPRQIPGPYGSKLHIPPTNYHLLAAQKEPYKKA